MVNRLPGISRGALYSVIVLFAFCVLAGAGNLLWTSYQVGHLSDLVAKQRAELTAECAFNRDLAPLPISTGPTGKASLLGVEIVADSRAAWFTAGCPGKLPPPSPSLRKWAAFYHRKVR